MQSLNIAKSLSLGFSFSHLPPSSRCPLRRGHHRRYIRDDTGEEFLDETELMEPDKDLGNDASTRIPNYGRPATAALNLLLAASADSRRCA